MLDNKNSTTANPQAYDVFKRAYCDCRIEKLTPKNRNYPNGGAYIYWVNPEPYGSTGGWVPANFLKATPEQLSGLEVSGY